MTDKLKVLFLCTGNSCRSQMAEGYPAVNKVFICRHWLERIFKNV